MPTLPQLCPDCFDGTFAERAIDFPVTVATTTALVHVTTPVCQQCGNILLNAEAADAIDHVREMLERGEVAGMQPVGTVYRVSA